MARVATQAEVEADAHAGALIDARHGTGVVAGADAFGLYVHRQTGRAYWTARDGTTHGGVGATYRVMRSYLDGRYAEVLLASMPHGTRAVGASISADGRLHCVFVSVSGPAFYPRAPSSAPSRAPSSAPDPPLDSNAYSHPPSPGQVSQPGNASLLMVAHEKASATDATPSDVSVFTLRRGVAPTSLATFGTHIYFSVAAARAIYRCALDGTACVALVRGAGMGVHEGAEAPGLGVAAHDGTDDSNTFSVRLRPWSSFHATILPRSHP